GAARRHAPPGARLAELRPHSGGRSRPRRNRARLSGHTQPPSFVVGMSRPLHSRETPMVSANDVFASYARIYDTRRESEMSLEEYLERCRDDPMMYASAPERLLAAIGEPEIVDTSKDARLGRIMMNRTIKVYSTFSEF